MNAAGIQEWYRAFAETLGESRLSLAPWELECYSRDSGSVPPRKPAMVIQPRSLAETEKALGVAAGEGIPLVLRGGGTSMCGAPVPLTEEVALLDLTFLRGSEVKAEEGVVVAEAGSCWTDIRVRALRKGFDLGLEGPWSAPAATLGGTLAVSAICMGAARHGTLGSQVTGLEVYFPAYGVVRLGSWSNAAASPVTAECNGPDIGGLLLGSHGTLGVILRACLKLFLRAEEDALAYVLPDVRRAAGLARELALNQLVYDCRLFVSPVPEPMGQGAGLVCLVKEPAARMGRVIEEIRALAGSAGAREVPGFGRDYYAGRLTTRVKAFGTAGPGWLEVAGYLSFDAYPHVAEETVGFFRSRKNELDRLGIRWSVGGLLESRSLNLPVALFCNESRKDSWSAMLGLWEEVAHFVFGMGVSPYWIGHMAPWLAPRIGVAASVYRELKRSLDPGGILNRGMLF